MSARVRVLPAVVLAIAARAVVAQPSPDAAPQDAAPPDAAPADTPPPDAAPPPARVVPPAIAHQTTPIYPDLPPDRRRVADVFVRVDLDATGAITNVHTVSAADPDFDDLALASVGEWTFAPAHQDGVAVPGTIDVTVHFDPDVSSTTTQEGETIEIEGKAARVPPPKRGASDYVLPREQITAAPHRDAGEMLAVAPGVYVGRGEGDAVAHSLFLRGFDAEHGQDIELSVAGVPINQRSHIHGQGYADLGFLIPEVVRSIRVTEGVYDPRQGDFATAGSISFDLGVEKRGLLGRVTGGSFGERRYLVLWAPEGADDDTFAAIALRQTDGFGENRGSRAAQLIAQRELKLGDTRAVIHAAFAGARGNTAGVLRVDDIDSGKVGY
jgi:TonB family protein